MSISGVFGNPCVEELRRALHGNGHLILDVRFYVLNAQYFAKKRVPELLVFALLAATLESPVLNELAGSLFLVLH